MNAGESVLCGVDVRSEDYPRLYQQTAERRLSRYEEVAPLDLPPGQSGWRDPESDWVEAGAGVWRPTRGAAVAELNVVEAGGRLAAPVKIERDRLGVSTLTAANRVDLAYATGFVHGQDRFFEMDLSRRLAAGEL